MIIIKDLWKNFNGLQVLKGLNLSIEKRKTTVIIGRSGSGKSLLLKIIVGLIRPDKGEIWVSGVNTSTLSEHQLREARKRFGMVFQESALFDSLNVMDNVTFFLREHTNLSEESLRKVAVEKLRMVGLVGIEDKAISTLSGGMKKRVALARAIATDPEVVLYDEPTTGIDPVMGASIINLIRSLQDTLPITSVVVTHDIEASYKMADKIAMLYNGRIIFVGTPQEIKATRDPVVRQFISGSATGPISIEDV
jgi:phospholipid/cholesterol/gamma-HCH transport system ATP-binding protein